MIDHISDDQLELIKDKSMAKEIYDALKSIFERKSVAGQLLLRKRLCTMIYNEMGDMNKHLLEFDKTIRELKGIGAKLEDMDVICQLPKSYDALVTSLETLLDEYRKRNVENKKGISESGNAPTAMNAFRFPTVGR